MKNQKKTQCDIIMQAMLKNPGKEWWSAKDFQHGHYFVGYEASARMSDLKREFPSMFNVKRDNRYRLMSINWEYVEEEWRNRKK